MWSKYRKTFGIIITLGALAVLVFGIKYYVDISYQGDTSIRFVDARYSSLEALLTSEDFSDKILYVDFWFSTCGFCRREFKELPRVKEYLADQKNVVFLYIAHRTRHPNTEQLWKNAIQEYDLTGWHYMMDRELESDFWSEIRTHDPTVRTGYPHYLIIDHTSGYRNYNAPKPSELEDLKQVLGPLIKP